MLVLLAGSDRPPPPGFAVILVILAALVGATGLAIPWLWRVQAARGARRVLVYSLALGAVIGLTIAVGFVIRGSGEPSITAPSLTDTATWLLVLSLVGAVNGALVGGVAMLARPSSLDS